MLVFYFIDPNNEASPVYTKLFGIDWGPKASRGIYTGDWKGMTLTLHVSVWKPIFEWNLPILNNKRTVYWIAAMMWWVTLLMTNPGPINGSTTSHRALSPHPPSCAWNIFWHSWMRFGLFLCWPNCLTFAGSFMQQIYHLSANWGAFTSSLTVVAPFTYASHFWHFNLSTCAPVRK